MLIVKKWIHILFLFIAIFLIFNKSSHIFAMVAHLDQIILYENGHRITDSLTVFQANRDQYPINVILDKEERCFSGICNLSRSVISYTYYRPKTTFLTIAEWFEKYYHNRPGCETVNLDEIRMGEALERDSNPQFLRTVWLERGYKFNEDPNCKIEPTAYFKYLESNSSYFVTISIPQPMNDMMQIDRSIKLDLRTKKSEVILNTPEISGALLSLFSSGQFNLWLAVIILSGMGLFTFIIYSFKKRILKPVNARTQPPLPIENALKNSMYNSKSILKPFSFIALFILSAVSISSAFYFSSQNRKTQQQLNIISRQLSKTKQQLALMQRQNAVTPTPSYCAGGQKYANVSQGYTLCYPSGWNVQANSDLQDDISITENAGDTNRIITIRTSSDYQETVLQRLASNVYTDTIDRNFTVDDISAIQLIGTVPPSTKKAITIVTKNGKTHELVLTTPLDASFDEYFLLYKGIVDSFRFLQQSENIHILFPPAN